MSSEENKRERRKRRKERKSVKKRGNVKVKKRKIGNMYEIKGEKRKEAIQ